MISRKKIILYFGLAGIFPALFFIASSIYNLEVTTFDNAYFIKVFISIVLGYLITATVSAAVIYSIPYLDKIAPWEKGIWKRIITEFFYTNFVALSTITVINNITYFLNLTDYTFKGHLLQGLLIAFILNAFLTTFYEGIRLFNNWKHSLVESERLEKESMTAKFEALKNQVNPHFLFNSLNTLSSLVYSDTEKAEKFIDEFASIYRYILDNRDRIAVSLSEEIKFIKSYIYLQKIRFGDCLVFNMKIDTAKLNHVLPTLSLQLLVENAIKHNVVTSEKPLEIEIADEGFFIVVKNNLQLRDEKVESVGVGIENLKQRYQLISGQVPSFEIVNEHYIAKLPLIQPE